MLLIVRQAWSASSGSDHLSRVEERGCRMNGDMKREAAFAGQRVKQKVIFALALCSVIPLLVLTYVIHGHLMPGMETTTKGLVEAIAIPTLVAFTGLLMAGGGYVVWDLASAVSRTATLVASAQPTGDAAGPRHDEIGTLDRKSVV